MSKERKKPQESRERKKPQLLGFLGVGFDHDDDEKRLTRSEHFLLVGGSQETHERMQDTAIRFHEALERTGKPLHETPPEKVIDMLREAQE